MIVVAIIKFYISVYVQCTFNLHFSLPAVYIQCYDLHFSLLATYKTVHVTFTTMYTTLSPVSSLTKVYNI